MWMRRGYRAPSIIDQQAQCVLFEVRKRHGVLCALYGRNWKKQTHLPSIEACAYEQRQQWVGDAVGMHCTTYKSPVLLESVVLILSPLCGQAVWTSGYNRLRPAHLQDCFGWYYFGVERLEKCALYDLALTFTRFQTGAETSYCFFVLEISY